MDEGLRQSTHAAVGGAIMKDLKSSVRPPKAGVVLAGKPQSSMTARIYKPAKTAMQSGRAKTMDWVLEFEPEEPRAVESLMGWTSSGDMKSQIRLRFAAKEGAIAYAERHGIPYQVFEPANSPRRGLSYADNFSSARRESWTH
jgi:hypothetical protein